MNALPVPQCAGDGVLLGQSPASVWTEVRVMTVLKQDARWDHQEGGLVCTDAPSCEGLDEQGRCVSQTEIVRCPLGIPHIEVCSEGYQCQPLNDDVGCKPLNQTDVAHEPTDGGGHLGDGGLTDASTEGQPMTMASDDDEWSDSRSQAVDDSSGCHQGTIRGRSDGVLGMLCLTFLIARLRQLISRQAISRV